MAARSTNCRRRSTGSPAISACITCITCRAASRSTGFPKVLRDHPELGEVSRLGLKESLACVRLALWDEQKRRLVSFREARASRRLAAGG